MSSCISNADASQSFRLSVSVAATRIFYNDEHDASSSWRDVWMPFMMPVSREDALLVAPVHRHWYQIDNSRPIARTPGPAL